MTHGWLIPLLGAVLVGTASGCGGQPEVGTSGNDEDASARAAAAPASVRTATVPANPCDWIPADQVVALIGPLDGPPERVRSFEQPKPSDDGNACLYRLAAQPRLGRNGIVVEVSATGGVIYERTAGAMRDHFAGALRDAGPGADPAKPAASDEGWDYSGHLPAGLVSYIGRLGHVSVLVVSLSSDVPRPRLAALAARIRDRLPDLPFPLPTDPMLEELKRMDGGEPEPPPSGPNPCGLLTRAEAEAVLGKLVVEPYRSNENTPLVDPYGKGCTYLTAGHHALVLKPHWDSGKMMFGMARSVGGTVASVLPEAGPDRESADTLEGPWDEAAGNGTTGDLYFLKGDRMLELGYLASSTGPAGAVRLARIAVERL
jgi:hypothetical protein